MILRASYNLLFSENTAGVVTFHTCSYSSDCIGWQRLMAFVGLREIVQDVNK
jgi:hypothetical protein